MLNPTSVFMATRSGCTNYPSNNYAVFGSNDASNWVQLGSGGPSTAPPGTTLAVSTNSVFYRMIRMTFYRSSTSYVDIVETRIAGTYRQTIDTVCTAAQFQVRESGEEKKKKKKSQEKN